MNEMKMERNFFFMVILLGNRNFFILCTRSVICEGNVNMKRKEQKQNNNIRAFLYALKKKTKLSLCLVFSNKKNTHNDKGEERGCNHLLE